MAKVQTWRAKGTDFMHRFHARMAGRAKPPTGFVSQPEPQSIGLYARGRQLTAGNFLFAGELIEAPAVSIWDISPENEDVIPIIHGCTWLDDLAAVGDHKARQKAQDWVYGWIDRYGGGTGPGWIPDLVGRRLIRWINHGFFILRAKDKAETEAFFVSLARQTLFLSRRWRSVRPGLPRFEALVGMIYAGLSLEGMSEHVGPAVAALAEDCRTQIDQEGGVVTRNPEELLEILTLLSWAQQSLIENDRMPPDDITDAIGRIAPTLRALRHSDGGLARFHGGGRGIDGRIDYALAKSGNKAQPGDGKHMGFGRMHGGRTTVVIDAAPPPSGEASFDAHASTGAFELSSGRRPLIVSCGSGKAFGDDWRRFGRATASHSTLAIEGYSSSRLGAPSRLHGLRHELLIDTPDRVLCEAKELSDGMRFEVGHNGYQVTHGLTHARMFELTADGRGLVGEDLLTTLSDGDTARFDRVLGRETQGVAYSIRFHLHPEVDASVDMGGTAVSLTLRSGEIWVFRHDGTVDMRLEPSVYLENGRLKPRGTQQVVLSGRAMSYATRVRWSLAKAQETPQAIRDFVRSELTDVDQN